MGRSPRIVRGSRWPSSRRTGTSNCVTKIIQAAGDLAYEVGVEQGQAKIAGEQIAIEHRVTNIYRREAGEWKVVHHHTDVSPAMVDILRRLQAA